jgi:hypothetical protein
MSTFNLNVGRSVIRVAIPWIMGAVDRCRELSELPGSSLYSGVWIPLVGSHHQLYAMYNGPEVGTFLRVSRPQGNALLNAISALTSRNPKMEEEVELWDIKFSAETLRPILLAEINVLPSFLVTGKEGYDVNKLIEEGHVLFSNDMFEKKPMMPKKMQEKRARLLPLN